MRGYTTFTQEHGDEQAAALATAFASIATSTLEAGGGTGLEFRGDEVLAVFTSARQAIRAATDLQDAFVEATITDPSLALPVGIGLDAGEAVEVDDGYRGAALNLAARLCAIAGPGEILASQEIVHLAGHVEGITRVDRGSVRLKGFADPIRVNRLTREGWDPDDDVEFQRALGPRGQRTMTSGAPVCPYRGLTAFQPEHADNFFGREKLVADLVDRLDRDRVLFVVGPSGSGKSSVVRAGLIPAISANALPKSEHWSVALFTPRADPISELSYQLRRIAHDVAPQAVDNIGSSPSLRVEDARRLTDAICGNDGALLMVIDQFEELFTLNQRREQESFISILAAVLDPVDSRVRAVMSLRADFYGACATIPWLSGRVPANQVLVGPMGHADLRKAIEQPAATAGLRLEDGLVDAVLEDGGSEPAGLPLVSHAMAETWRRRDGSTLTLAGYREAGGVAGSIAQTADSLFETSFDEAEQDACHRLMLRLVTPGEGTADTRRRLPMRDLDHDREVEVSRRVAANMIDVRLLTVDRDSLEIAHEALLHSWPRLRGWIEAGRDDLRMRQRVGNAAAEWVAAGRDVDLLSRGTPLQAALEWAEGHTDAIGPLEEEYLAASEEASLAAKAQAVEAAKRSRRLRRVSVSILAILTVAAVAASIVAFSALAEARSRYGQALANQATVLADSDARAATGLALEAMARGDAGSVAARSALVDASQVLADARFVPSGPAVSVGDASSIAISPDGELIVTGNRDGSISTWSATGQSLDRGVPGHTLAIEEMDFTPDGQQLVSGGDDTTIRVWDLADPTDVPPPTILGQTGQYVWSVAVSPNGRTVASASEDGTVQLWDLDTRRKLGPPIANLDPDALTVAFSPDGQLLLVGNGAGEVTGWSLPNRRIVIPTFNAHESDVWEIEFDSSGSRFATASADGRIRVWDTATGKELAEPFKKAADNVQGVLIDATGDVLAGDENGRLLVSPAKGSTRPVTFAARTAQVVDAARGGDTLATLGNDQRMQVWSRAGDPTALVVPGQPAGTFALAASPDGTRIATGDGKGNVRIFSVQTGQRELGPIQLHAGRVSSLAFSADGSRVVSGGVDGGVKIIDAATGDQLPSPANVGTEVAAVLFADGRLLAAGGTGTVWIWSGQTLEAELGPLAHAVTAMAVSSDNILAAAEEGGSVHLWDLSDGHPVGQPLAAGEKAFVWSLAWSMDGSTLAVATDDEVVQLWDVPSRSITGSLTPQPGGALDVAFLSDGATIATTSRGDGSVRLWDIATSASLGDPLPGHEGSVWGAVALPGMRFATSGEDGTIRIWDILNQDRACDRAVGSIGLGTQVYLGADEKALACVQR
ncbi:MAG TPA: hypothetical protein VMT88_03945 [Actinomycetes bacterium]|nr:hypothetical protein [Actinomycetes bacterium]